jgi:hypothetical protein
MTDLGFADITLARPPEDFDFGDAGPPFGVTEDWYLLDDNHILKFLTSDLSSGFAGIVTWHRRDTNVWCGGGQILFSHHPHTQMVQAENPEVQTWELISWNPFTLDPSLACTMCDSHGFIYQNRWVDL